MLAIEPGDMGLRSPFLRVLAEAGREYLSQLITEGQYQPGEVICREGEPGDAMYIVWSGRVAVLKGHFNNPTVLGYRGVGEIIGEMALLENEPRSASIVALETVRLLTITRENFETLLSKSPSLGLSILGMLSARLRAADDARKSSARAESQLQQQVSKLKIEKEQLLDLERVRQDTIHLIVHDLRHPLSSIFGAIKILEMVLPDEVLQENRQLISIANSNCDQLQLMVESLLDVARMEEGNPELKFNPIDMRSLIEEAIHRVKILADMENIAITLNLPENELTVEADEEKIFRIMGNLLHNAVKFTTGGGEITVTVEPRGQEVFVGVTDTGPGIPPEARQRIFDRFAQISGLEGRSRGFGLGLAFCRLAVQAHGGRIWVEPGPEGSGSQFAFTLPVAPHPPRPAAR